MTEYIRVDYSLIEDLSISVVSGLGQWIRFAICNFHQRNSRDVLRTTSLVVTDCTIGSKTETSTFIFSCSKLLLISFLLKTSWFSRKLLILRSSAFALIWRKLLRLRFTFWRVGRCSFALILHLKCLLWLVEDLLRIMWLFGRNAPVVILLIILLTMISIEIILGLVCRLEIISLSIYSVHHLFVFVIHLRTAWSISNTTLMTSMLTHRRLTLDEGWHWLIIEPLGTRLVEEIIWIRVSNNLTLKLGCRRLIWMCSRRLLRLEVMKLFLLRKIKAWLACGGGDSGRRWSHTKLLTNLIASWGTDRGRLLVIILGKTFCWHIIHLRSSDWGLVDRVMIYRSLHYINSRLRIRIGVKEHHLRFN